MQLFPIQLMLPLPQGWVEKEEWRGAEGAQGGGESQEGEGGAQGSEGEGGRQGQKRREDQGTEAGERTNKGYYKYRLFALIRFDYLPVFKSLQGLEWGMVYLKLLEQIV